MCSCGPVKHVRNFGPHLKSLNDTGNTGIETGKRRKKKRMWALCNIINRSSRHSFQFKYLGSDEQDAQCMTLESIQD